MADPKGTSLGQEMKYELVIKPEAEADIEDSFDWYKLQSEGLGDNFVYFVEQTLEASHLMPFNYQLVYQDLRRAPVHRFPHLIFYFLEREMIYVLACVYQKRAPKVWKTRKPLDG